MTWNEPTNTGPPIASYQVAYRKYRQGTNSDEYEVIDHASTERKVAIAEIGDPAVPLEPQTQYEVRVRATNGEGTPAQGESIAWGDWSPLRLNSTGASNVRPVFANMDSLITLLLPENTRVRAERRQRCRGNGRRPWKQADLQSRRPRQGLLHHHEHGPDTDQVGRHV